MKLIKTVLAAGCLLWAGMVLADPPKIKDEAKYSSVITYPNIGILSIAAYLRAHLPAVEVIYLEVEPLEDHLERYDSATYFERLGLGIRADSARPGTVGRRGLGRGVCPQTAPGKIQGKQPEMSKV